VKVQPRKAERFEVEGGVRSFADLLALHRPDWQRDAACHEHPEIDFVPEHEGTAEAARAIEVCRSCLVRLECLGEAMRDGNLVGIWGGRTTAQRRAAGAKPVRTPELKPITHGTANGYQQHRRRGEAACEACLEAKRQRRSA
jgi:WhiB family redox-sensing transcriptional regulator